jgi:hypothetical protein
LLVGSLGVRFGPEAVVIGPREAVAVARETADRIASAYAEKIVVVREEMTA